MSTTPLAHRVRNAIARYALAAPGDRVLVACSGGADSVALLLVFHELHQRGEFVIAAVAHLHHGLRGDDADEDQRFCRDLAARLGHPFETGRVDTPALAREWKLSIEAAARRARYAWLGDAATRVGADRIAVGHTRNDQAETVLLKLFRGAGARGLGGISPRRGRIIRPLLDIGRDELVTYLGSSGQPFREDLTNRDLANPRNWIRHQLLPSLRQHLGSGIDGVLARHAAVARDEDAYLDTRAIEAASAVVLQEDGSTRLRLVELGQLPPALARRVVREALVQLAQDRFIGLQHVDAVLALARPAEGAPASVDVPGVRAERRGREIRLERREGRGGRRARGNFLERTLSVPGDTDLPELDMIVTASRVPRSTVAQLDAGGGAVAAIAADRVSLPLGVRTRRPGDRFRPPGLGGRKKVQDFFVDRKVPVAERDRVPIVVDADNRVVWIVGGPVAEDFRVTTGTEAVIFLTAKRLRRQVT